MSEAPARDANRSLFRRVTYRPELISVARFLHVSGFLKRLYWRVAAPPDGVFLARTGGVEAKFFVQNPGDWRKIEGTYTCGRETFLDVLTLALRPGDTFYDVGSNIGEYAVFASKVVGDAGMVVTFEPERANHQRILDHVRLNKLSNVLHFNLALGDRCQEALLEVNGFSNTQCRLVHGTPSGPTQSVGVVSGDAIRKERRLPFPNAIKMDIEGYEFHALQGLKETLEHPACRLLCCEVHPAKLPSSVSLRQVMEFIRERGFRRLEEYTRGTELHLVCWKESENA